MIEDEDILYKLIFTDKWEVHIKEHQKSGQKQLLSKIRSFLEQLKTTPKKGTGKPEALKGYGEREMWSRRINEQHRLVYEIFEEKKEVKILTAFGHYDDK